MRAIVSVLRRPQWVGRLLRGGVTAASVALVLAVVCPQPADALAPALGRWAGGGPDGRIQFVVSRVRGTLVLSDVVLSCATAEGVDTDDQALQQGVGGVQEPMGRDEAAIEPNGRIDDHGVRVLRQFEDPISGHLSGGSGTVTAGAAIADLHNPGSGCPRASFRDLRVAPSGARAIRDGVYSLSGPVPGTGGFFYVYGEGALIEYGASFGTPLGGLDDDPEACAEGLAAAAFPDIGILPVSGVPDPDSAILPGPDGSFSLQRTEADPLYLNEVTLSGRFSSPTTAVGAYSATSVLEDDVLTCTGAGAFALTLVHAAPALVPDREPEPAPPRPTPPTPTPPSPAHHQCEMRFQIQKGSRTPYSRAVPSPVPVTVAEAVAKLDSLQSEIPRSMRNASKRAFTNTRDWVIARPMHGGVSATGNVKRSHFEYEKDHWRLDTENLRCTNLTR